MERTMRAVRASLIIAATTAALTGCSSNGTVDASLETVAPVTPTSGARAEGTTTTAGQPDQPEESAAVDETAEPEPGDEQAEVSSIPLEQWQLQMESICVAADNKMVGVDFTDDDAWSSAFLDSVEVRAEGVRALPRPAGSETQVEELLGLLDAMLATEAESGAAAAVATVLDPDSDTATRFDALVAELGLEDCGKAGRDGTICALVPADLIGSLLGQVPEPDYQDQFGAEGCKWENGDDSIAIQIGSARAYGQAFDYFRESGQAMPGVGDEAYLVDGFSSVTGGSTRGSTLWVMTGDDVHAVGAMVGDEPVDSSVLTAIAAAILTAS